MNKSIRVGVIGLGNRGTTLLKDCLLHMQDVTVAAVYDEYEDRRQAGAAAVEQAGRGRPATPESWQQLLAMPDLDAVLVFTAWASHIPVACAAMRAGKYVAMEVGGAYALEDCWQLVRTSEETGVPCMLLENCCYGRDELMVLNMARQGVLGELVHCQGGYRHDLRQEVANGLQNRHYRYQEYLLRNCENYPTHEFGPIANLLDLNRGNRPLTLVSMASKAAGLGTYLAGQNVPAPAFAQADVVTTVIRCARGETICLTLDTTLPRCYSRGFQVQGTKGMYCEDNRSIFLDGVHDQYEFDGKPLWGNVEEYRQQYEHPIWQRYLAEGIKGGHDGMDWLVLSAFAQAVRRQGPVPIDVYDTATWMAISCLSEESISMGGAPRSFPDFTSGRWLTRAPDTEAW